ncbi:hypothetical protein D3C71_2187530 [compost metagenome]
MGHESVHPRLQDAPAQATSEPFAPAAAQGQDPLARAQALVAELSAELARLRGQS